jgi:RNA polymerase sigma-70 factor (ECF subfamily)
MVEKAEASVARELVDRILTGDEEAESELVRLYGPSVMRMLQALTQNRWSAEDIHQETFTIVLRRLRRRRLDNPEALGQFLRQTARKVVMASNRKRRLRQQTEIEGAEIEEIIDPEPGQLVHVLRKEEDEIVRRTIADIRPLRYRQLLLRFYLEEEAKEIICAELGLSAVHFNRVLFRARRRFLRAVEGQEMRRSVARRQ